jgi:hypothetical protein
MSQYLEDIRQGDRYEIKITYPEGTDITGYKFWITLKRQFDDPDSAAVLQTVTTAGNDYRDEPSNGFSFIVIPEYQTANAPKGSYYWDVQARSPEGVIKTLLPSPEFYNDRIRVVPQVTRGSV